MAEKKPRKKRRRSRKPQDERTRLCLRIEDYRARAEAEINHHAHGPQYAFRDTQEEPLYEFQTHLEIFATCHDPEDRAGDRYQLTVYTETSPESSIYWKLRDVQAVNEHHSPQYREYRGKSIPVYVPPKGMGMLEKERGEPVWHGAIWAQPRYVNDLLVLLSHDRQLYLLIDERKIERQCWIQGVSLQTTDPAEE